MRWRRQGLSRRVRYRATTSAGETAGYNADGVSTYPVASGGQLLIVTVPSAGSLTVVGDQNNAGSVSLEQANGTFPYTVDSNGRISAGGGNVIFYVVNSGRFFGTEQPAAQGGGGAGLLTFQQQTGSGFSCADLNGSYGVGTIASVVDMPTTSGEATAASGSAAETLDRSALGVLQQGATQTSTCSTDSLTAGLGRMVISTSTSDQLVLYTIVQGQKFVLLDVGQTTTPAIFMLEK
jgi:hypothetical protein